MQEYFARLYHLLRPGARLLNHAIGRPGYPQPDTPRGRATATARRIASAAGSRTTSKIHSDFMQRYVFPDGELHGAGRILSAMQDHGFEPRHEENLREHYAMTLRDWGRNLQRHWTESVAEVGLRRARVWELYMAASRVGFDINKIQLHQILGVKLGDAGRSGFPLRPSY